MACAHDLGAYYLDRIAQQTRALVAPFFANKDDFWGPKPRPGSAIDQRCDQCETLGKSSSSTRQLDVSCGLD